MCKRQKLISGPTPYPSFDPTPQRLRGRVPATSLTGLIAGGEVGKGTSPMLQADTTAPLGGGTNHLLKEIHAQTTGRYDKVTEGRQRRCVSHLIK